MGDRAVVGRQPEVLNLLEALLDLWPFDPERRPLRELALDLDHSVLFGINPCLSINQILAFAPGLQPDSVAGPCSEVFKTRRGEMVIRRVEVAVLIGLMTGLFLFFEEVQ